MTALILTPTSDTVQGWLIIAMLALAAVCGGAGAVALGEQIAYAIRRRRRESREWGLYLERARDEAIRYGYDGAAYNRIRNYVQAEVEADQLRRDRAASEVHE